VSGSGLVGFGGSRSFPVAGASFVGEVVSAVVGRGLGVGVGCAAGADEAVLRSAVSAGAALSVFAVGGSSGAGFWRCSAVSAVRAAASAGASVSWWAGGGSSVPLRRRLRARSAALLSAVVASGSRGFVAFVGGAWAVSPGSWSSVRAAVLSGVPVVVFPFSVVGCGLVWGAGAFRSGSFPGGGLPSLARWCGPGSWVPAGSASLWGRGFRWVRGPSCR
jgi:hypothetical protein